MGERRRGQCEAGEDPSPLREREGARDAPRSTPARRPPQPDKKHDTEDQHKAAASTSSAATARAPPALSPARRTARPLASTAMAASTRGDGCADRHRKSRHDTGGEQALRQGEHEQNDCTRAWTDAGRYHDGCHVTPGRHAIENGGRRDVHVAVMNVPVRMIVRDRRGNHRGGRDGVGRDHRARDRGAL